MKPYLLLMALVACGPAPVSHLEVKYISPELQPLFNQLQLDLSDLGHPEILRMSPNGITVLASTKDIAEKNKTELLAGYWAPWLRTVVVPAPGEPWKAFERKDPIVLDAIEVLFDMTHELGHAILGPEHSDHGLMTAFWNLDCELRAAECLIEAMAEAGVLDPTSQP